VIPFIRKVNNQLKEKLTQLSIDKDNSLKRAESAIQITHSYADKLKAFIIKYIFKKVDAEVKFFKDKKPLFSKSLFYI